MEPVKKDMDHPEDFGGILIRLAICDGTVESVSSAGSFDPGSLPRLEGKPVENIVSPWPPGDGFVPVTADLGSKTVAAAARMDSDSSVLIYFLDDFTGDLSNPALPVVRLVPDAPLPLVSPGFVCLLGYTPWELSQSDLISSLPGTGGMVTLLDKSGNAKRLVFSVTRNHMGGNDYFFLTQPDSFGFRVKELENLARMKAEEPLDFLSFLVDALGLDKAVLLSRTASGYIPVATVNMEIDQEQFESSSIFHPDNLTYPIWVDLERGDSPFEFRGQCLVYPYGRLALVAPWRGDADTLQRRADALMPAVAIKYDQFLSTHGEHRLANLLDEIGMILASGNDYETLEKALNIAAAGFGASVIAVYGPEETSTPIATSTMNGGTKELLSSDKPFEECFEDTHIAAVTDGYTLLAAWDSTRSVPYSAVDTLAGKLAKFDMAELKNDKTESPDFSHLQAVLMVNTKVIWQGRNLGISNCYQFFGNSRMCADCPVPHLSAAGNRSARLENHHGYIEEIFPSGSGFLVTWTRLPGVDYGQSRETARFPGGEAFYTPDGRIATWNGWFQEATGIGLDQVMDQNAARILNRIGIPVLLRQYRAALADRFIPEPVEFNWRGLKCFSVMKGTGDGIRHTVLDSNRAGIPSTGTMGPGVFTVSKEPEPLAEFLSTACRREGWEFDISGSALEDGSLTWLSRRTATELLSRLLRSLTPMCPDRWTGLETGWLDNTSKTNPFAFLPGQYHVLQFRLQGLDLAERTAIIEKLGAIFRSFGGWLAASPGNDVLQAALPAARKHFREYDAIVYSPIPQFTDLCNEVISKMKSRKIRFVESAEDLATRQQTAGAVICRLDHGNMHYATTLTARIPSQPILVASGLSTGIPLFAARTRHLQLPVDEEILFTEIRRTIRSV